jgi:hypothetical protein
MSRANVAAMRSEPALRITSAMAAFQRGRARLAKSGETGSGSSSITLAR